jgi:AraC-like DNA-binding protein
MLFANFIYAGLSGAILFLFETEQPTMQAFALLIPLAGLMIIQIIFLLKKIRSLTHSGSIFQEERYRFSVVYILLTLYVIIAGAIVCEFIIDLNPIAAKAVFAFDVLFAVLLFLSGFISHSGKFIYVEPKARTEKAPDDEWVNKVNDLMENEKPWLNCELTLGGMAEMLGLVEYELTQILNQKMKTNFYSLINNYRVETVKEKLKDPENRQFTILAAAYESGFNSKSTFYRIFKEHTGQTPKQFMDGLK